MVCLEIGTIVEVVEPEHWVNDRELLDACAAYCVEEDDWANPVLISVSGLGNLHMVVAAQLA